MTINSKIDVKEERTQSGPEDDLCSTRPTVSMDYDMKERSILSCDVRNQKRMP